MNQPVLAIDGGERIFPEGPPSWPVADDEVLHNVQLALAEGTWGKYESHWTDELASAITKLCECEHTLLCSSGTVGVEIALRAVDVKAGDEVILAAYDFPGNFRAIEAVNARPVIVDVIKDGWVIDPAEFEAAISEDTAAVIVSHLHGQIADCSTIQEICQRTGVKFIEDVCQVPGATLENKFVGSFGDVCVFSFGGSKLLSAGRGGAISTRNAELFQRAKIFCNRGNDAFPLSQLQAAALLPQVEKLDQRNHIRLERAKQLIESVDSIQILQGLRQTVVGAVNPAFYKLPWLIEINRADWTRDDFVRAIRAEGVAIDVGFRGFTRRSAKRCRHHGALINSRIAAQQTVILHHPVLLESEKVVELVALAIEKVASSKS